MDNLYKQLDEIPWMFQLHFLSLNPIKDEKKSLKMLINAYERFKLSKLVE